MGTIEVPITVAIPVGPKDHHQRWLRQCFKSIGDQTVRPAELFIVGDGVDSQKLLKWRADAFRMGVTSQFRYWLTPWPVGVTIAFNSCVMGAHHSLVFMLGSDDLLEPQCIEKCWATWQEHNDPLGYYYVGVRYMDDRDKRLQTLPCNAAMVTQRLWKHTGGFPVEAASGAPDAALISILMAHPEAGTLYPVDKGSPLYNVRVHPDMDTAKRQPWQGIILQTRNLVTEQWKPSHD